MKTAERRHERQRALDITASAPRMREESDWLALFPAREQWHEVREQNRPADSGLTQEQSLLRAIRKGLYAHRPEKWAVNMKALIGRVQNAALDPEGHHFQEPRLIPFPKSNPNEFRIAANLQTVEDKIIDRQIGSYLRAVAEPHLVPGAVAYRARGGPDREGAIRRLVDFRHRHSGPLFVSEIDIQAFFDCVPHEAALRAVDQLPADSQVDPRARSAVASLLMGYDRSSLRAKEAELRTLHRLPAEAVFPWPEEVLNELHPNLRSIRIGLPQGTAISTVLANLVLCEADRASITLSQATPGADTLFLRYCDDAVWVSISELNARTAQRAFQEALLRAKLPCHPPQAATSGAAFYGLKSKLTYPWSGGKEPEAQRWVSFLGYQVDCAGQLRIRKDSVIRLKRRMVEEVDEALDLARRPGRRVSVAKIFRRTAGRLMALSTGRVGRRAHYEDSDPRCWAKAFRLSGAKGPIRRQLRCLDSHRHRITRHLFSRLMGLNIAQEERDDLRSAATGLFPLPASRSFVQRFTKLGGRTAEGKTR